MPLFQFQDGTQGGQPARIGTFNKWALLHIQVTGPNTLRLAASPSVLLNSPQNQPQGLSITQADGLKSIWWIGDCLGLGNGPVNANIEIMDGGAVPQ